MTAIAVDVRDATKVYGATTALAGASLVVQTGEVHGLLGENGAGKSTLVRMLAGLEPRDGGEIVLFDQPMPQHFGPDDVAARGVAFIHQDLGLVEDLSVLDNIALICGYPRRGGLIDYRLAESHARAAIARIGLELPDVHTEVGKLPLASRALVAIARALALDARLIVLDEPTATLQAREAAELFEHLDALRDEGVACLLISHRMDEIMRFCDRVTVFRNGVDVATRTVGDVTRDELIGLIVGHAPSDEQLRSDTDGDVAAASRVSLSLAGVVGETTGPLDIDFTAGTVTAVTGLSDSGHLAVARQICGVEPLLRGAMALDGAPFRPRDIADCLAAGISYVPPDRLQDGLAPLLTLRENLFLNPTGPAHMPTSVREETAAARRRLDDALVSPAEPDRTISTLSGGNQQKVLLAKALVRSPRVLVLCEPTAGVDIGAKREIHRMIREISRNEDVTVIVVSSDFEEVADVSDRALVLSGGHIVADLRGADLTLGAVTSRSYAHTPGTGRAS